MKFQWYASALLIMLGLTQIARANVDLDLRPNSVSVLAVGQTVKIKLFAVSDNGSSQSISGMDVILKWDPNFLTLTGFDNTGAGYSWLQSGFLYPGGPNATFNDGDAIWTAFAVFASPAFATPAGLQVTEFQFKAKASNCATIVKIVTNSGLYQTAVYSGLGPNINVTGSLDNGVSVNIPSIGDTNGDGCVNDFDLANVIFDFGKLTSSPTYGQNGQTDFNCDGVIDDFDIAIAIFDFGQGCSP